MGFYEEELKRLQRSEDSNNYSNNSFTKGNFLNIKI